MIGLQFIGIFVDLKIRALSLASSESICEEKCKDIGGYLPYFFQGRRHICPGNPALKTLL